MPNAEGELSNAEQSEVEGLSPPTPAVVHAAVSKQGEEELDRPTSSLFWSAVGAGITIMTSVSVSGALHHFLPEAPWKESIVAFGYPFGFLIVVMGRMQLFTEQTLVAVLPLARDMTRRNLGRVGRLWSVVFVGNLVGTAAVAALVAYGHVQSQGVFDGMVAVSSRLLDRSFVETMMQAVPAGFIMASIAWIRSADQGGGAGMVFALTLAIGLCGFAHVIAGAAEAFLLLWAGVANWQWVAFVFLLPALLGNVLGGTGLFAVLVHAQVQGEIAKR